jgi:hypothetical protein
MSSLHQRSAAASSNLCLMAECGSHADVAGTLVRDSGGFALRSDSGPNLRLLLHRVPVDYVEKRVRVIGVWIDGQTIEAEGVAPL